jgi:hypothetical protein
MNFQKNVIVVAFVLLCLFLIVVGILLYKAKSHVKFPPEAAQCPDYWTVTGEAGTGYKCKAGTQNLGFPTAHFSQGSIQDFSAFLTTKDKKSDLCKELRKYNIVMDGVTNANLC